MIGTLPYMAPEQLEGKDADFRSDIFAFGLVFYEMVTGQRAFSGGSPASLIAAILTSEPAAVTSTQPLAPRDFDRVVRRCLEKDPVKRWQAAQDIVWELEWSADALAGPSAPLPSLVSSRPRLPWLVAGGALTMFVLLAIAHLSRSPQAEPVRVLSIVAPPEHSLSDSVISPDGSRIAFVLVDPSGKRQLSVRPLDSLQHRVLPGTDGARDPFWSPDGRHLGFFAQRSLKRISVVADAATAQVLAGAPDPRGGTWNADNVIIFSPNLEDGLYRVPAAGGEVAPFTRLDRASFENSHRWPQFLPDGRTVIFMARASAIERQGVFSATLGGGERKLLLRTPYATVYAPGAGGGSILFVEGNVLMSRSFDPQRLQLSGEATPITDLIEIVVNKPQVSSASNGTLVYQVRERPTGTLAWHDRNGKSLGAPLLSTSEPYLRVSRDDRYAVTHRVDPRVGSADIWILDLQRGTETRSTSNPAYEWRPVWSPDASRIAFGSNRNGTMDLYVKRVNSTENEQLVFASADRKIPTDWTPDGRFLVFEQESAGKETGLYALLLDPQPKPVVLVDSEFDEIHGVVSPDGRWLAYASNETGVYEVYVRKFTPPVTAALTSTRVSNSGGSHPHVGTRRPRAFLCVTLRPLGCRSL